MRRSILLFSCALSGVSILLTTVLIHFAVYRGISERLRQDTAARARLVAAAAELIPRGGETDYNEYFSSLPRETDTSADETRLTLIDPLGNVLFDSAGSTRDMENHAARPEIIEASARGFGEGSRTSVTTGKRTYYYAVRLGSGHILRAAVSSDNAFSSLSRIFPLTLLIAAVVFAAAAIIGRRVTDKILAPVNAIDPENPRENEAYAELLPLLSRIRAQNEKIAGQIADQYESERLRREFSANVSHELKTPLTIISGYAEILSNGVAKTEDAPRFAGSIYAEAQRLIALVGDIMMLSRLDEGKESEARERVELLSLARDAADTLREKASERGIMIDITGEATELIGIRHVIGEIMFNLIDNAVKYNRDGGRVTVTIDKARGAPTLTVEDTGIGIPPAEQDRVFERFYRVDKSRGGAVAGTGLGLSIVKHGAMLHGAKIEMHSDGESGTVVAVRFA